MNRQSSEQMYLSNNFFGNRVSRILSRSLNNFLIKGNQKIIQTKICTKRDEFEKIDSEILEQMSYLPRQLDIKKKHGFDHVLIASQAQSIIIQILMSSIIDEMVFHSTPQKDRVSGSRSEDLLYLISKIAKFNDESIQLEKNESSVKTLNKFKFKKQQFAVKTIGQKANPCFRTNVLLLNNHNYWSCSSNQNQMLLMKQISRRQKECTGESNIFLFKRCLYMTLVHFLVVPGTSTRWITAYRKIIIKNILHLEQFMHQQLQIGKRSLIIEQKMPQLEKNLLLSQTLNTTQTTEQILQEKNEYKFANKSLEKQNEQLVNMQANIDSSPWLQKEIKRLFLYFPLQIQSLNLKYQLINSFQNNSKVLKSLLNVKYPPKKRIEDYICNKVKAEIINDSSNSRMVGEGGTSILTSYRMSLSFLNSNQQAIDKMVVLKRQKPQSSAVRNKIDHQKRIVSKMKDSISFFIPKYYEVEKVQLKNCILMEFISGEELDYYIKKRSSTISFWSKVYIMLNVIQGLRHLISYNIVHLDLKPLNILVGKSQIAKLIDFGEAYHPDVCPKNYIPGITFPYVAPEVYQHYLNQLLGHQDNFQYSQKQDAFALGIIMSQVFFGSSIFYLAQSKFKDIYARENILQRVFYASERNELYGDDLFVSTIGFIIVRCLDPDPIKRPRVQWIGISLKLMLNSFTTNN